MRKNFLKFTFFILGIYLGVYTGIIISYLLKWFQ